MMADAKVKERTFFAVRCDLYDELKISVSKRALKLAPRFLPIAISSKSSIKEGMKAVRNSPFDTVFVIDVGSGKALFALSQNMEFVKATKKKGGGGGGPKLPPSPVEECCTECIARGASGCLVLENMDCWCLYDGDGGDADINDPLEVITSTF